MLVEPEILALFVCCMKEVFSLAPINWKLKEERGGGEGGSITSGI